MLQKRSSSGRRAPRLFRRNLFMTAALVAISISPMAYFTDFGAHTIEPSVETSGSIPGPTPAPAAATASIQAYDPALVDPAPALPAEALRFAHNTPLAATFTPWTIQGDPTARPPEVQPPEAVPSQEAAQPLPAPEPVQTAQAVPLPVPRPREFQVPKPPRNSQAAIAAVSAPVRSEAPPSAPVDNRSFFEKLIGIKPASAPPSALSYASLDNGTGGIAPSSRFVPSPNYGAATAVYDISARTVYMPNGERLEAHSGLGDKLDDPRYVHVRMKGATPPGTYILTEREALFHGVRALRMNPVGGSAAIHGRDGILAHTYMLGPNGDSNGCVSFRDYNRFLQAYLQGEVKRLVVVPGRGDALPRIVNNRTGRAT